MLRSGNRTPSKVKRNMKKSPKKAIFAQQTITGRRRIACDHLVPKPNRVHSDSCLVSSSNGSEEKEVILIDEILTPGSSRFLEPRGILTKIDLSSSSWIAYERHCTDMRFA